jgi:hypothetical protein
MESVKLFIQLNVMRNEQCISVKQVLCCYAYILVLMEVAGI